MASPRALARRPGHWIVTLWESYEAFLLGGLAFRGADATTRTGDILAISSSNGQTYHYPPTLRTRIALPRGVGGGSMAQRIDLAWDKTAPPADVNLRNGWGEIAWVDENATGTGTEQTWETRLAVLQGPISELRTGDRFEGISFVLKQDENRATGSVQPSGAALTSERFADISNSVDGSRAPNSDGQFPPIIIGPADSTVPFTVPAQVVVDEVDAVSGVSDITYRRFLLTAEPLYDMTTSCSMSLVDPARPQRLLTGYSGVPTAGEDAKGGWYAYMRGQDLTEEFPSAGAVTIQWTAASPTVTGVRFLRLNENDQVRAYNAGALDGADSWLRISSIESVTSLTLASGYEANHANVSMQLMRRPANVTYNLWVDRSATGGIPGPYGKGAMGNPAEVIEWLLSRDQMSVPPDLISLRALAQRLSAWEIHTVINSAPNPWEYIKANLLPILPIQHMQLDGKIRFFWDGPAFASDSVTSIDLDSDGGVFRSEMLGWTDPDEVYTDVRLHFQQSLFRSVGSPRYERVHVATGDPRAQVNRFLVPTGRSSEGARLLREGCRPRVLEVSTPVIREYATAGLVAGHLLYRFSKQLRIMSIDCAPSYRWIEPWSIVSLAQNDTLGTEAVAFRVLTAARGPSGQTSLALRSLPA